MLAGHVFVAPGPELVLVLVLICDEFLPLFSTLKIRKKRGQYYCKFYLSKKRVKVPIAN